MQLSCLVCTNTFRQITTLNQTVEELRDKNERLKRELQSQGRSDRRAAEHPVQLSSPPSLSSPIVIDGPSEKRPSPHQSNLNFSDFAYSVQKHVPFTRSSASKAPTVRESFKPPELVTAPPPLPRSTNNVFQRPTRTTKNQNSRPVAPNTHVSYRSNTESIAGPRYSGQQRVNSRQAAAAAVTPHHAPPGSPFSYSRSSRNVASSSSNQHMSNNVHSSYKNPRLQSPLMRSNNKTSASVSAVAAAPPVQLPLPSPHARMSIPTRPDTVSPFRRLYSSRGGGAATALQTSDHRRGGTPSVDVSWSISEQR